MTYFEGPLAKKEAKVPAVLVIVVWLCYEVAELIGDALSFSIAFACSGCPFGASFAMTGYGFSRIARLTFKPRYVRGVIFRTDKNTSGI